MSLTQLNPIAATRAAMSPTARRARPSAAAGSRCDAQLAHASFTRRPSASTTHRDDVDSGSAGREAEAACAAGRRRRARSSGSAEAAAMVITWPADCDGEWRGDLDFKMAGLFL